MMVNFFKKCSIYLLVLHLFVFTTRADCIHEVLSDQQLIQKHTEKISNSTIEFKKEFLFKNGDGFETWTIYGYPKELKLLHSEGRVFRHYSPASEIIKSESSLQTGITPYIIMHPGVRREIFENLTGVFLTDPGVDPRKVGVPHDLKNQYIDLIVPGGYTIFELEPGIYLIPTPPVVPGWLREAFDRFRLHGQRSSDLSIQSAIERLTESGAMTRPIRVPILVQKD